MEKLQNLTPNLSIVEIGVTFGFILAMLLLSLTIYYLINIGNRHIEKEKRITIDLKLITRIFIGIFIIYVLNTIFKRNPIIGNTIAAILISIIVAFVINPIVSYLETRNIERRHGVLIVYISFIIVFVLLLVIVIPKTIEEIRNLLSTIPTIVENFTSNFSELGDILEKRFNLDTNKIIAEFETAALQSIQNLQNFSANQFRTIATGMYSLLSRILGIVLVFIFSFYFTVDKDRFKSLINKNLPLKYRNDILFLSHKINSSLLEFVKGKLLLALFVGGATTVLLLILRVDFAIVIGIITCIADIIPYIGPFLGFLPAVIFALIESRVKALWVAIFFIILQWVENNILAPKIIGTKTGLHPMIVLISIIIGGGMFGVGGMILSVPFVSVIIIVADFIRLKLRDNRSRNMVDWQNTWYIL